MSIANSEQKIKNVDVLELDELCTYVKINNTIPFLYPIFPPYLS